MSDKRCVVDITLGILNEPHLRRLQKSRVNLIFVLRKGTRRSGWCQTDRWRRGQVDEVRSVDREEREGDCSVYENGLPKTWTIRGTDLPGMGISLEVKETLNRSLPKYNYPWRDWCDGSFATRVGRAGQRESDGEVRNITSRGAVYRLIIR